MYNKLTSRLSAWCTAILYVYGVSTNNTVLQCASIAYLITVIICILVCTQVPRHQTPKQAYKIW